MPLDENLAYEEVYERGAVLLTALAYPQQSDPTRSLQLYLSLCGKALWLKHLMEPGDWTPIQVRPQYVFRDPKVIDRHVAYVAKRLGERMVAGRMAIALELCGKIGDGVNQAADLISATASIPSLNFIPLTTFVRRASYLLLWPQLLR